MQVHCACKQTADFSLTVIHSSTQIWVFHLRSNHRAKHNAVIQTAIIPQSFSLCDMVGKCEIGYNSKNKEEYEGYKKKNLWKLHGEFIKVIIIKTTTKNKKNNYESEN